MIEPATYEEGMDMIRQAALRFVVLAPPATSCKKMLDTVTVADGVGAIFEPTMYRDALRDGRLDKQRKIIEAAIAFHKAIKEAYGG